jgi:hypothetical protein
MSKIAFLDGEIKKVCPIHGVALLAANEVRIDYKDEATPTQKIAAQNIAAAFDWGAPTPEEADRKTLRDQILGATEAQWLALTEVQRQKVILKALKYMARNL